MLGQFACAVPDEPEFDEPGDVEVDSVFVEEPLVAAWAAAAPPTTRTPETASTAAAFRILLIGWSPPFDFRCRAPVNGARLRRTWESSKNQ